MQVFQKAIYLLHGSTVRRAQGHPASRPPAAGRMPHGCRRPRPRPVLERTRHADTGRPQGHHGRTSECVIRYRRSGLLRPAYPRLGTRPQDIPSSCLTGRDGLARLSRWTLPVFRDAKAKPCGMARAKRCGARTHVLYGPLCDGGAWGSVAARPPSGNARPLTPQELPATKEPTPGWWNW